MAQPSNLANKQEKGGIIENFKNKFNKVNRRFLFLDIKNLHSKIM